MAYGSSLGQLWQRHCSTSASDPGRGQHIASHAIVAGNIDALKNGGKSSTSNRLRSIKLRLRSILAQHSVAEITCGLSTIAITPKGAGFPIFISECPSGRIIVEFGNWHEDEYTPEHVEEIVGLALRGQIRLIDTWLNGKAWRHTSEKWNESDRTWQLMGQIAFVRFVMLRRVVTQESRQYPSQRRGHE